jgi:ferredoxin-nitrite reductase
VAVGLCVPTGRVNPEQLDELARLADKYGNGAICPTTGQNAITQCSSRSRHEAFSESLLRQFSSRPLPLCGLVACVGTDYCNLALIETKSRAVALPRLSVEKWRSQALNNSPGPAALLDVATSVADIGLHTKIDGKLVDAVAVYAGRTGPYAVAGKEILATVACDGSFPDVIAMSSSRPVLNANTLSKRPRSSFSQPLQQ